MEIIWSGRYARLKRRDNAYENVSVSRMLLKLWSKSTHTDSTFSSSSAVLEYIFGGHFLVSCKVYLSRVRHNFGICHQQVTFFLSRVSTVHYLEYLSAHINMLPLITRLLHCKMLVRIKTFCSTFSHSLFTHNNKITSLSERWDGYFWKQSQEKSFLTSQKLKLI